ncbi:MAG: cadherin-like domain-containing protein, partial [bacterium]|nr:cadherin-like domain-containing protein [bacterium]
MKVLTLPHNDVHRKVWTLLLIVVIGTRLAQAGEIFVSHCNDSGAGSLREAISSANTQPGYDHIIIQPSTGRILLNSALPTIKTELRIDGAGRDAMIIDANGLNQVSVFRIDGASVTLCGLSMVHGRGYGGSEGIGKPAGGGILSMRTVSLRLLHCRIQSNQAEWGGGMFVEDGNLWIEHCILEDNQATNTAKTGQGGGIYCSARTANLVATMIASRITANQADSAGGGIYVKGYKNASGTIYSSTVNLDACTLSANQSSINGGGIFNELYGVVNVWRSTFSANTCLYDGGGIFNQNGGTFIATNSTLSGNWANRYGGGIEAIGTTTMDYCTVVNNVADYDCNSTGKGGGVDQTIGTCRLFRCLVANNTLGNGSSNNTAGTITTTNCFIGTTTLLGPLAGNGGETQTHALLEGFVAAIDQAGQSGGAGGFDQTGTTRPQGSADDIGAFEYSANKPPSITEGDSITVLMSEDGLPTAFNLTLHASDADGDGLTWSIATQASHGTAIASGTGETKAISYTPEANYHGSDSFVVRVEDGQGGSDSIIVNVEIEAVNDAPNLTEGDTITVSMSEDGSPTAFALT